MDEYMGVTKPIRNVGTAKPNLDDKYGPYNSLDDAKFNLSSVARSIGLTVGVKEGNSITEYWFNGGIDNIHLVRKQVGEQGLPGDVYTPEFIDDVFDI